MRYIIALIENKMFEYRLACNSWIIDDINNLFPLAWINLLDALFYLVYVITHM